MAAKNQYGRNNPFWKGGPVCAVCEHCQKEFSYPRKVSKKVGRKYCSFDCSAKARVVTDPQRFWKRTEVMPSGCIEWRGAISTHGYGFVNWAGQKQHAHRAAYRIAFGEIPEGMVVCHKCDNPPCCNPDHLFIGTQGDNVRDCVKKGRNRPFGKEPKCQQQSVS